MRQSTSLRRCDCVAGWALGAVICCCFRFWSYSRTKWAMCPTFGKPISTLPFVGYRSNLKRGGCVVSLSWWMGRCAPLLIFPRMGVSLVVAFCVALRSGGPSTWQPPLGQWALSTAGKELWAGVAHIARSLLKLPLLRYVEDYWSPDR